MDRLPLLGVGRAVMKSVMLCGWIQLEYGDCSMSCWSTSVAASEREASVRLLLVEALAVTYCVRRVGTGRLLGRPAR